MLQFLRRFRIGSRLTLTYAALLLIFAVFGTLSLMHLRTMGEHLDTVVLDRVEKTQRMSRMNAISLEISSLVRDIVLEEDPVSIQELHDQVLKLNEEYKSASHAIAVLPNSSEGLSLLDTLESLRQEAFEVNERVIGLALAGDAEEAEAIMEGEARDIVLGWRSALVASSQRQLTKINEAHEEATAELESAIAETIGIGVLTLAIAVLMAWSVTRSLVAPITTTRQVANNLARGQLGNRFEITGSDEMADLGRSMVAMQDAMERFTAAQAEIAQKHDEGEIDHVIPSDRFEGAYREMADQVNALAKSHIDAVHQVADYAADYARGDLSRDFPVLPGKKVVTTEAVAAIKANMQAATGAIAELVESARSGDFGRRGDPERFEFTYREMIEQLNDLMGSADSGLDQVDAVLSAIARGDLTQRADTALPGKFGRLATDANLTVDQLTKIVSQIRSGSDAINAAASEIAAGNRDLSSRTEQQAASLEEAAASMEELTTTVQHNAEHAGRANALSNDAARVAQDGGEVVGQVVQTMESINEASSRIVDIISVIDAIAFQTNILALNAAVEAARAGDQGRGFAVVASEVRSLAQRSATAAKEIKALIDDSVSRVDTGSEYVAKAGQTMGEIVASVSQVSTIVQEIAAASAEQSAGIEQVAQSVSHMDEGTQQNAALVEEATAAAASLEQQANALVQAVSIFQLDTPSLREAA